MSSYLVIDTETTGLDCNRNQLMQIAAIVYDNPAFDQTGWENQGKNFNFNIQYDGNAVVEPTALRVNKRSFASFVPGVITSDRSLKRGLIEFVDWYNQFKPCDYLVGFNVQFDMGFLQQSFKSCNIGFSGYFPFKTLDPFVVGQSLICAGILPTMKSTSLKAYCEHFNIQNQQEHDALADARASMQLHVEMQQFLSKLRAR